MDTLKNALNLRQMRNLLDTLYETYISIQNQSNEM